MMTFNPFLCLSHGFIVLLLVLLVVFFFFVFFFFFLWSYWNRSDNSKEIEPQRTLSSSASDITSSSSSSINWTTHDVFPSFSGEDVRRTFLSHVHREFQRKGILTFKDNGIERSRSIGPELIRAIQESRVAIVVLSKSYASSSWCLNELLEIMRCRETWGQIVMTVFHGVDPSDVRKQTGEFGRAFKKACVGISSEEKQRWKLALSEVANIAGEHSEKWDDEADMIEKIAVDVSNVLNSTPSRDFTDLVGVESHMGSITTLLSMGSSEVRFVGIWGPAGTGKTTIARALFDRLSTNFRLRYFMANIKGRYKSIELDSYGLRKNLQEQLLLGITGHKGLEIDHLGVASERLKHHKVFLVLDDIDNTEQLEALAKDKEWFGPGSRIIVTTQNRRLLRAYQINHIYQVPFPSSYEALQIFCQYAFGQTFPPDGFYDLAVQIANLVGNLPLGLSVLGSSMRGMSRDDWDLAMPRLMSSLDGDIERTLKEGFDRLSCKDKSIFLYIACLFHGERREYVSQVLANSDLDIDFGLNVLAERSLICKDKEGWISMHDLLQNFGRELVRRQGIDDPGRRQFLWDGEEIYDVLSNNTGAEAVLGISLDFSDLPRKLIISDKTFERMSNLRFLRFRDVYRGSDDMHSVSEGFNYLPSKLTLLEWDDYPKRTLPSSFCPEFLIRLDMERSALVKLWEGTQPLGNLRYMNLRRSYRLRELPDLSRATNLQLLNVSWCSSLVAVPSSLKVLNKLEELYIVGCKNLESLPSDNTKIIKAKFVKSVSALTNKNPKCCNTVLNKS